MIQSDHYYLVRWAVDGEAVCATYAEAQNTADELIERHPYVGPVKTVEVEVYENVIDIFNTDGPE